MEGLKALNSKALTALRKGHKKAVAILSCLQENDVVFYGQRKSGCKVRGLE